MRPHLKYASYVARHKWFVFVAGLRVGAPLWRLVVHDWSKLTPAEWGPYVRAFFAKDKVREGEFDRAWLHHQHRNPHHWQHWLLRADGGDKTVLEMPEPFLREMVADWMGAGRAITGKWGATDWYLANRDKMVLGPVTRINVELLLGLLKSHEYPLELAASSDETAIGSVVVERVGLLRWDWSARGVLARPLELQHIVLLPTGTVTTIASGVALSRRGALRRGRRLLKRYCAPRSATEFVIAGGDVA